jgi:hypothetical protein
MKIRHCFWQNFDRFISANPVNAGPNWASGQEVALRLIPWLAAAQIFTGSPEFTPTRKAQLSNAIWQHARRIQPTLAYARSQNNNHYLSEALGLMLAGYAFQQTSEGKTWLTIGFRAFEEGIIQQIAKDGTYSQHSNNYHRMMLHLSLLFMRLCDLTNLTISLSVRNKLVMATRWLLAQLDPTSGRVPNLGHNDGSNILPLGNRDYLDYRPTLQAACQAFLSERVFPTGDWDVLSQWLKINCSEGVHDQSLNEPTGLRKIGTTEMWGTLRSVHFHSRPAHADQLHVDLWWRGREYCSGCRDLCL